MESVTVFAAEIAKHRGSSTLGTQDLQLHLRMNWGIDLPLVPAEESLQKRLKTVHADEENKLLKSLPELPPGAPPGATVTVIPTAQATALRTTHVVGVQGPPAPPTTLHEKRMALKNPVLNSAAGVAAAAPVQGPTAHTKL